MKKPQKTRGNETVRGKCQPANMKTKSINNAEEINCFMVGGRDPLPQTPKQTNKANKHTNKQRQQKTQYKQ